MVSATFTYAVFIIGAYLLGSISSAYLIAKWKRGIDIREYGSGNAGARNIGRLLGTNYIFAVAGFDILKGALPVLIVHRLGFPGPVLVMTAMAAITGHNWPIFLNFRGGNGLATFGGIAIFTMPEVSIITLLVSLILGTIASRLTVMRSWIYFYNTAAVTGYIIMPILAWQFGYSNTLITLPLLSGVLMAIPQIKYLRKLEAKTN